MIITAFLAAATSLAPILAPGAWANVPAAPATAGRVAIVDVFAFSCINCKHVTPELRKLRAAYRESDLAIVGVHAPELPDERVHANLLQAMHDQDISWPVRYDDDFRVWRAYGVTAWPTQLIFDRKGKLRATIVGEGYDAELERTVKALVAER